MSLPRLVRLNAPAVHARVDLEVGFEVGMCGDVPGARDGVCRDLEAVLSGESELVRKEVGKDENRGVDAGSPQLRALLDRHDGQRAGASLESGAGDVDGAVPVGIGLYDGHEPVTCGTALEGADIVLNCA